MRKRAAATGNVQRGLFYLEKGDVLGAFFFFFPRRRCCYHIFYVFQLKKILKKMKKKKKGENDLVRKGSRGSQKPGEDLFFL